MRSLMIVALGALASTGASAGVWLTLQAGKADRAWCEVVDDRLIRTTASDAAVSDAIEQVLAGDRMASGEQTKQLNACCFEQRLECWTSSPDWMGVCHERARRLVRSQLDARGRRLRIEQLHGDDMPTLIFISHEKDPPAGSRSVAERLAERLANCGATRI